SGLGQRGGCEYGAVARAGAVVGAVNVRVRRRGYVESGAEGAVEHVNGVERRVVRPVDRFSGIAIAGIGSGRGRICGRSGDHGDAVNQVVAVRGVLEGVEVNALARGALGAVRGMVELSKGAPLRGVGQRRGVHRRVIRTGGIGEDFVKAIRTQRAAARVPAKKL